MLQPTRRYTFFFLALFAASSVAALASPLLQTASPQDEATPPITPKVPPVSLPIRLNSEGAELYDKKDFAGAAAKFEEALDVLARDKKAPDPTILRNFVMAKNTLAREEIERKDYDQASRRLRATLIRSPRDASVETLLGTLYYRRGLYRAALDFLLDAVRHDEKYAMGHFYLGLVEYKREQLESAIVSWERAAKIDPALKASIAGWLTKAKRELKVESKMQSRVSSHFVCKYRPDSDRHIVQSVLDWLETMYVELGQRFDTYPTNALTVVLYGDREFSVVTGSHGWVGGLFDGKVRVPVKNFKRTQKALRETLRHEYTHFLLRRISRRCPAWINEGLAQMSEGRAADKQRSMLREAAKAKKLLPLSSLQKSFSSMGDARAVRIAYRQSLSMTDRLVKRFSVIDIVRCLRLMAKGAKFDAAFERTFRQKLDVFYADWKANL